jgi:HAD superfamily phosphoserine phosphatase-like hydrolase
MYSTRQTNKMVVFDLDKTILEDRFIDVCARIYNFRQALELLRQIDKDAVSLTRRIANFLRDKKKTGLVEIADSIPLVPDTHEVVRVLKERSYHIGIISDSYNFVTQAIARKINADFELSNELLFNGGIATGEVLVPSYFHYNDESTCKHQVCKTNALRHICRVYQVKLDDCIVVGDGDTDACMAEHAGLGVSFCTTSELLKRAAKKHIEERSFSELLKYAV